MRFFLSYSQRHLDRVDLLSQDLRAMGHEAWFDREVTGGRAWWDDILSEIRRADIFVLALTPAALHSLYCRSELSYALALGKPVLPVQIESVPQHELPPELQSIQVLDGRKSDKMQTLALAKALFRLAPGRPLPDPLPIPPPVPVGQSFREPAPEPSAEWRQALGALIPRVPGVPAAYDLAPRDWQAHPKVVRTLAVSRDGRWLLSGDSDGMACLWEIETGQRSSQWVAHANREFEAVFLPDGDTLATVGEDDRCRLFELPEGNLLAEIEIPLPERSRIWEIAWAPDGAFFALGLGRTEFNDASDALSESYHNCVVQLWGLAAGTRLANLIGHDNPVRYAAISPDWRLVLSSDGARGTTLWTIATGHANKIPASGAVAFSPGGHYFVTGGNGGYGSRDPTILWHTETCQALRELPARGRVSAVLFAPHGRTLCTLEWVGFEEGGFARFWDLLTGEILQEIHHIKEFASAVMLPDGSFIALGTGEGKIRLRPVPGDSPRNRERPPL